MSSILVPILESLPAIELGTWEASLVDAVEWLREMAAKSAERRDVLEAEQYQALPPHNGQESAKPMVCVGCGVHYGDACTPDCAVAKALAD